MTDAAENDIPLADVGDLIREARGAYLVVNAIARRVRELQLGEKRLAVPPDGNTELTRVASQEFLEDKLEVRRKIRTPSLFNATEEADE